MRILALDSATGGCSATLVDDETVLSARHDPSDRGHTAILPVMVRDCLADAQLAATLLDAVAVTVGPGSFTGIRGAIALAQGIAMAAGVRAIGVTIGEAIAEALPQLGGRTLWVVTESRRGRIFLEAEGRITSLSVAELPSPKNPIAVAGNAASDIASRLAATGANVMLTDARHPAGRHIALVALRRLAGTMPPLLAEPLYIDAPEARPRAG